MRNHIQLGTISGIPIGVHTTTLWLLAIVALVSQSAATLLLLLVLAVVVLLHELGHALVAQRYGIQVLSITLYPFGGMAHMSMLPEGGREELVVALAGPAVNLALALPLLLLVPFTDIMDPNLIQTGTLTGLAWYWLAINMALGLFNMLPAFPLDGGRVLRALLVPRKGFLGATELAVRVGRFIALGMLIWGLLFGNFIALAFVAGFIWLMGGRELLGARLRHAGAGQGNPLEMFAEFFKQQQGAGFQGQSPFGPRTSPFGSGPGQEAPRDAEFTARESTPGGFSEEDIKRLESFHGRLPRKAKEDGA